MVGEHPLKILIYFFKNSIYLRMCGWMDGWIFACAGSSLLHGLSLASEGGGCVQSLCAGFLRWLLAVWHVGSGSAHFSSCGTCGLQSWAPALWSTGSVAVVHGLIAPRHVGLSRFRSVAQSCLTLCDPTKRSMPGLPVHHPLPEST